MRLDVIRELTRETPSRIVLCVLDGLGGLARSETGRTELQEADTPNLDILARTSALGLTHPVGPGITPGSGPGHLALFGFDPEEYDIGRGVLEATGIGFELGKEDVAARGNFCTIDAQGLISDRRAGRIPTARSASLVERLQGITLDGAEAIVRPVRDHRFVLVLRGSGLSDQVRDTDPQAEGVEPLAAEPEDSDAAASRTAKLVNDWVEKARDLLKDEPAANMLTLRGFAAHPQLPQLDDVYKLRAAAFAVYPMYRGLAQLVGMTPVPSGESFRDSIGALKQAWDDGYTFFFLHYKPTDAAGEDGDFDRKVNAIEEFDAFLPEIQQLEPDVLIVTGDHSTPALMAAHSWHPVPFLLSGRHARVVDTGEGFDEVHCARGALGTFYAKDALLLAMAHAGKLVKYGA
ncbi:MAG TPA: 2,3-bisphosphoglycerate-independent phosphoglycerate mutase [Dehalococcoidia bacterium]|nr:2,3-bisphosphoglycerate-independent phosphoglycerate mutase [Dehalococcoidia bacterium]